jgi:hypothetical protein
MPRLAASAPGSTEGGDPSSVATASWQEPEGGSRQGRRETLNLSQHFSLRSQSSRISSWMYEGDNCLKDI